MNRIVRSFGLVLPIVLIGVLGFGTASSGHQLQPGYLELRRVDEDLYAVVWKIAAIAGRPMPIEAELPAHCDPRASGDPVWDGAAYVARWVAHCDGGIEGGTIRIVGLERTSTDVLVRFAIADGAEETYRLTPGEPSFTVPAQPNGFDIVRTYFLFGVEHILLGIDHLLFVLGLLLLVRGTMRIIATITAFTLAHSITLAAATLGLVQVFGPPIEAIIALSIAFVGAEIIRSRRGASGLAERYPWIIAFAFGLLHGFGFAGALTEIGLPTASIPAALLFFNLGVEAGQLIFIAVVLAVVALVGRIGRQLRLPQPAWAWTIPSYAIGSVAMFWFVERIAAF